MIKVKGITKYFGTFKVLDDVNMNVKKGSVYGLVGPNGSGKTTIIKHIVGVYKQNKGEILIDKENVLQKTQVKQKIAYIPDELYFFPQYNIKAMAEYYSNIYINWDWNRYNDLKKVFKIDENKKINRLSKGMQRQVAFWLAVSSMPEVMILDEPVDGLDPVMRKKVWNLVLQDVAEREMSVLVSSHNLRELEDVCDCVGIMHKGKIYVEKNLDHLKSNVYKIQIAVEKDLEDDFLHKENVLHYKKMGSVYMIISRGDKEKIVNELKRYNPLTVDILPLTLEEVFIYEMRGAGYGIQDIIL